MSEIRYELTDHVARVTIDRPRVLNALSPAAEEQLRDIWARVEADRDVWVVVLTGAGERAFCVGADMSARRRARRASGIGRSSAREDSAAWRSGAR